MGELYSKDKSYKKFTPFYKNAISKTPRNINNKINEVLTETDAESQAKKAKQLADLALLSQGMLKGEALTEFVNRSIELV
jgi:molecular chaperone HtpG